MTDTASVARIDGGRAEAEGGPAEGSTAAIERALAEALADVLEIDEIPASSDFFDDLGADSLVMAHFCARLRTRPDLPSVSIKEVYQHRTIVALAAALTAGRTPLGPDADPDPAPAAGISSPPLEQAKPVGTARYLMCGTLQLLSLLGYTYALAASGAVGYDWIASAADITDTYVRSVLFGGAVFIGWSIMPIVAKWVLIGRWNPGKIRIWSLGYFRFWLVRFLTAFSPLVVFAGSPIYVYYLRALGAKVGRGTVVLSRNVPVCTDLLTIGDDAVVRKDSFFSGYRAEAGWIETGTITLGRDTFVGEATVLDINSALGDGAQIGHASTLHAGQSIPKGEHRLGTPAHQHTDVDFRSVAPRPRGAARRLAYSSIQVVLLFGVSLPLLINVPHLLVEQFIPPAALGTDASSLFTVGTFYRDALLVSVALFLAGVLVRLVSAIALPRLLGRAIRPDTVYPMYGVHYWLQQGVTRFTNVAFFTYLFGDTSYVLHYLRLLGYRLSLAGQTGANFGLNVKHDNPYHVTVGQGTMAADGLSLINAEYSNSSFRVSPVTIGSHSFFGNGVAYPAGGRVGDNCLLATKVQVPVEGDRRDDVGYLGSPSFEIPRLVMRDRRFDDLKTGDEFRRRLKAKNRHNTVTMFLFLLTRLVPTFGFILVAWSAVIVHRLFGPTITGLVLLPTLVSGGLFAVLVERASTGFRPLRPLYCSMYDLESWRVERYWKLSWQPAVLNGTPFKSIAWRLLGVRMGRRVFDDGCLLVDKTLVTVGDHCVLNAGSVIQPHSQEDGSFKSDRVTIGNGCTLGVGALVHYGVTMGDGAVLETNAFLMKGAEVSPGTRWAENPAREVSGDGSAEPAPAPAPAEAPAADLPQAVVLGEPPTGHETTSGGEDPGQAPNGGGEQRMTTPATSGRDYWRGVLQAAGFAAIPRWAPARTLDEHETRMDDGLVAGLDRLTRERGLPLSSVLLTAHGKVLAALTGEREVTTGYRVPGTATALPCRLTTEPTSWGSLLADTHRVESALLSHAETPLADLRRELGLTGPLFETVFEAAFETVSDPGVEGTPSDDLPDEIVLAVRFARHGDDVSLQLRYRSDELDEDAAARIAGYHLTALGLMVADPEAEHGRQSLLSAEELELQLDELAGPRRDLPDRRLHELFEDRVKAHPGAVAAVMGDRQVTYRQLNARANRLGRALLARGLEREGVVAVVTERNLDWMASVLAIFKAGGVYLPIEPHFPAERIASMLARSGCRLVLTETGSTTTLDRALDGLSDIETLLVESAQAEHHSDRDLGIEVDRDQLAYIYFTSGSTGEPKGAMCEHAGMLNHLYAKIDDLEIGEGEGVAQIAPQCFDISLWQLVSALLVGGRTLLIDQATLLDPQRFLDRIVCGGVGVIQVVPSYLEVLLTYLEQHPSSLDDLHCVSVTGEPLTPELAERWFAAHPAIKLANAYGLTETSDDTNHEVMDRPPRGRVPLGRAVNNVQVRVVDEHLAPVPLGAPGEIVFAGVCVGRGYINDPERSRSVFLTDPLDGSQRLYRSGDFGRWRPDGKLEFLGRRDAQVKIRGFRIEIGDIENALLRIPGIRRAAVVVTERVKGNKQLVGFYSGEHHDVDHLRTRLARSVPDYMVPPVFHWRESLPLTGNGKIDRKALLALGSELEVAVEIEPPRTSTERRLAETWADVLGVPPDEIGRRDDFFDRGGSSLSAVELVITLAGALSLKDVTRHPVLADMARLIDGDERQPEEQLLQLLTGSEEGPAGTLVCFPYAGGNAVNYRPMAKALEGSGLAVHAVELPGHELAADREPFAPIDDVAARVAAEIADREPGRVLLWGHSSGAALALETARRLHEAGLEVPRVFIGAQLLGDLDDRRTHAEELVDRSNTDIAAALSADNGYAGLGALDPEQAEQVGAAYRHDCVAAHHYLIDAMAEPIPERLPVPVTAVIAADDPATAEWRDRYQDWQLLSEQVDVHELPGGGHYFLRTRPAEAAEAVLAALEVPPAPAEPADRADRTDRTDRADRRVESTRGSVAPSPAPRSTASALTIETGPDAPPVLRVEASGAGAAAWAAEHRDELRALVTEHGSVLVRGLDLRDEAEVGATAQNLTGELMTEREAFAARDARPGGLYSSSAWPPNQLMCMHHELSYALEAPSLMLFACLATPAEGGETAVADSSKVLAGLPAELVDRFEREGWMLVRNYTDEIGLSYAEAFGTGDRAEVERYCRANDIEFEWGDGGELRTRQRRAAIVRHPVTGQRCWFNQIAFLSEWTMNPEVREFLVDLHGPEGLPFTTRFANGQPIPEDVVQLVNEVYEENTVCEPWQVGDLLLVDNLRTAHSRRPFDGPRQVLVALADPVRLDQLSPRGGTG